jgi:hypothetical protein
MAWLGRARFFSATVAMVAAIAWFTGTNHCFLEVMKQPGNTAVSMSHCPDHSEKSGDGDDASSGMLACCQGLQSPNFELAKAKIVFIPALVPIQFLAIGQLILPEAPTSIIPDSRYDTGPPSAGFFVRTVLRRSLRENGPPLRS